MVEFQQGQCFSSEGKGKYQSHQEEQSFSYENQLTHERWLFLIDVFLHGEEYLLIENQELKGSLSQLQHGFSVEQLMAFHREFVDFKDFWQKESREIFQSCRMNQNKTSCLLQRQSWKGIFQSHQVIFQYQADQNQILTWRFKTVSARQQQITFKSRSQMSTITLYPKRCL